MVQTATDSPRGSDRAERVTTGCRGRVSGAGGRLRRNPELPHRISQAAPSSRLVVRAAALLSAIVLSALLLGACASWGRPIGIPMRNKTRFASEWKDYEAMSGFKALAVAGDPGGVYASGWTSEYCDQQKAVADALTYCEQRRLEHRIAGECRVYAIGNEIYRAGNR
jgi:hypothetical protein